MEETPGRRRSLLAAVIYELRRKNTRLEQWLIWPAALVVFGVLMGLQALGISAVWTAAYYQGLTPAHETTGEAAAIGGANVVVLLSLARLTAYAIERRRRRARARAISGPAGPSAPASR